MRLNFLNEAFCSPLGAGGSTPHQLGYHFPAEFEPHEATWLSWLHKEASWPGKIQTIYKPYTQFIKAIADGEKVRINVNDEEMKSFAEHILQKENVNMQRLSFSFIQQTMRGAGIMVLLFLSTKIKKQRQLLTGVIMHGAINIRHTIWMM